MTLDIIRYRLHNQRLTHNQFTQPGEAVAWLGAVQSQDYAGAKWGLGLRIRDAIEAAIETAFNEGNILRTHILRPTWHFVAPEDIRWMLALTAPRVHAANAFMYRQLELDRSILRKSYKVLEKVLRGGKHLTRAELGSALAKAGIPAEGLRLGYFMMSAELDGIICSGARKGKQFTYALLEERAPQARGLQRDEALTELSRRYFRGHGPATLQDFVWWSGLTMNDARNGVEAVRPEFEHEIIGNQTYWFPVSGVARNLPSSVHLLPNYDEYTVGYRDRDAIFDASHIAKLGSRQSLLAQSILINGQVEGLWNRTIKKSEVIVEISPFTPLKQPQNNAIIAAAEQYGNFLGLTTKVLI